MKYRLFCGIISLMIVSGATAQETNGVAQAAAEEAAVTALERGNAQAAENLLDQIRNLAARLYVQAFTQRLRGNPETAIQTAAKVVALHSEDRLWMARTELLIAELYLELGMTDAAEVTARQVQSLYEGMDAAERAGAVCLKIENLKEVSE